MTKPEIKNQFAILYSQDAELWTICDATDWPDSLKAIRDNHLAKVSAFKAEHFLPRITLTGYESNENISHYDIDDAIIKHFKDAVGVVTDSEGGQFFCYVTKDTEDDVTAFLKENYKTLSFERTSSDEDDDVLTPFPNWAFALEHCKANELEVPSILDSSIVETLLSFDKQIEQLQKKKAEYIETLKTVKVD